MAHQSNEQAYRPRLEIALADRQKIEKAASLTRRTPNKFIEKCAVDCADRIIKNHAEAGVEEALTHE